MRFGEYTAAVQYFLGDLYIFLVRRRYSRIEIRLGTDLKYAVVTIIGIDDTDSRTHGMCTTYVADSIARAIAEIGSIDRVLLIRCNPAVKYKTRGNAALAIHTDAAPVDVEERARAHISTLAIERDDRTQPGLVIAPGSVDAIPSAVEQFAVEAVQSHHDLESTVSLIDQVGFQSFRWGDGRGVIGALAAIGAWPAFDDWTYEHIAYRAPDRWGTTRDVESNSVRAAADSAYPTVWDTIDRGSDEIVCVPRTPGPVLYGIRGDDPAICRSVAADIESEPVDRERTFITNQGTDAHLQEASIQNTTNGHSYCLDGTVSAAPETKQGGHVFFTIEDSNETLQCVAFEPTKRFRDRVRQLRNGDQITACGEIQAGTLKLEKFAVRTLMQWEWVTPRCQSCDRTMESAGAAQGYRCRRCGTSAATRQQQPIDRSLKIGWYEVPPRARRHIAKPLIRGGFDAPVYPEQ